MVKEKTMLKKGDKVVCPLYGAGSIVEIVKEKIDKTTQEFYKIQLVHSNMELLIPADMLEANGIRQISSDKQLSKALNILKKDPIKLDDDDMQLIMNELNSIIKSSNIVKSAEWMSKLIYRRRTHGQLNANEKKLYLNFKSLICGELALIKNLDYKEAEKQLEKVLKKNFSLTEKDIEFLGLEDNENVEEPEEEKVEVD